MEKIEYFLISRELGKDEHASFLGEFSNYDEACNVLHEKRGHSLEQNEFIMTELEILKNYLGHKKEIMAVLDYIRDVGDGYLES